MKQGTDSSEGEGNFGRSEDQLPIVRGHWGKLDTTCYFREIVRRLSSLSFSKSLERFSRAQGFFLCQVGANDGRTNDPANKFIRSHKPQALLIEPQPESFRLLEAEYPKTEFPGISLLQVAVGRGSASEGEKATLWKISDSFVPEYLQSYKAWANPTGISSFSRMHVRDFLLKVIPGLAHGNRVDDLIDQIEVPQLSLAEILLNEKVGFVSALQVDVEGFDGEVVNQMLDLVDNGALEKPHLIHFEGKNLGCEEAIALLRRLRLHKYVVVRSTNGDLLALEELSFLKRIWFGHFLPILMRGYPSGSRG